MSALSLISLRVKPQLVSVWHKHGEGHEQQTRCGNAKVRRVENLIADFVARLMRSAVALRRQEEERELRGAEQQKWASCG
jgi:hypothetical protein